MEFKSYKNAEAEHSSLTGFFYDDHEATSSSPCRVYLVPLYCFGVEIQGICSVPTSTSRLSAVVRCQH